MIAYRVHQLTLSLGDSVPPSTAFFDALDAERKQTEDFLERHRPNDRPARRVAVFVFEDIYQAKSWASRAGRALYEVEIADADVLHRGDWSWLQIIRNALQTNAAQAEGGADIYWSGLATETPVWELLARNVKVLREINIPIQERLGLRAKAVGLPVLGQVPDGQ